MKTSFTQFLVEKTSAEKIMTRMTSMLEVIDKDMGNVFVCRDREMGSLTNKEHTFEVRIHADGDVEVHPHNDADHDRASEIEKRLIETIKAQPIMEVDDKKRAAIMAQMKTAHDQQTANKKASEKQVSDRMTKKHGPDWKKVVAKKEQERKDAHNKKVQAENDKPRKKMSAKEMAAHNKTGDAYAGRRKGSNWTGD